MKTLFSDVCSFVCVSKDSFFVRVKHGVPEVCSPNLGACDAIVIHFVAPHVCWLFDTELLAIGSLKLTEVSLVVHAVCHEGAGLGEDIAGVSIILVDYPAKCVLGCIGFGFKNFFILFSVD